MSIDIPGAGISTRAQEDGFNGPGTVTGISSAGIGPIHITAINGDTGLGISSEFGEVTLTPTSITSRVEDGQVIYTIAAGTGVGDAKVIDEETNPGLSGPPTFTYETAVTLDITSFTGTMFVTSVPLPASTPMFGTALAILGMVGFDARRVG